MLETQNEAIYKSLQLLSQNYKYLLHMHGLNCILDK